MYSEQVKSHFVDILFNKSLLLLLLLNRVKSSGIRQSKIIKWGASGHNVT